jgi:hypothetical protein
LAFVPILSKEIEGAGCVGFGEEFLKVALKIRPTPDGVHCPCRGYRAGYEDGEDVWNRVVDDGKEGDGEQPELEGDPGDIFPSEVLKAVRGS